MSYPTYFPILRDMKSIVDAPGVSKGGLLSTEDQRLTWSYGGYDDAFPIAPRGNWPMLDSKSVYPTGHIREDYAKLLKRKRGLPDNAPEPVITGIQALIPSSVAAQNFRIFSQ